MSKDKQDIERIRGLLARRVPVYYPDIELLLAHYDLEVALKGMRAVKDPEREARVDAATSTVRRLSQRSAKWRRGVPPE